MESDLGKCTKKSYRCFVFIREGGRETRIKCGNNGSYFLTLFYNTPYTEAINLMGAVSQMDFGSGLEKPALNRYDPPQSSLCYDCRPKLKSVYPLPSLFFR